MPENRQEEWGMITNQNLNENKPINAFKEQQTREHVKAYLEALARFGLNPRYTDKDTVRRFRNKILAYTIGELNSNQTHAEAVLGRTQIKNLVGSQPNADPIKIKKAATIMGNTYGHEFHPDTVEKLPDEMIGGTRRTKYELANKQEIMKRIRNKMNELDIENPKDYETYMKLQDYLTSMHSSGFLDTWGKAKDSGKNKAKKARKAEKELKQNQSNPEDTRNSNNNSTNYDNDDDDNDSLYTDDNTDDSIEIGDTVKDFIGKLTKESIAPVDDDDMVWESIQSDIGHLVDLSNLKTSPKEDESYIKNINIKIFKYWAQLPKLWVPKAYKTWLLIDNKNMHRIYDYLERLQNRIAPTEKDRQELADMLKPTAVSGTVKEAMIDMFKNAADKAIKDNKYTIALPSTLTDYKGEKHPYYKFPIKTGPDDVLYIGNGRNWVRWNLHTGKMGINGKREVVASLGSPELFDIDALLKQALSKFKTAESAFVEFNNKLKKINESLL